MEIEQIWQYGKERGADFFSPYICNVEYYNEGHYMVHSGGIGYEDGKPCEGMAAMLCMMPGDHVYTFQSITCELVDDEVKLELHVPANCYRAEKLPLYYAGETIELGKGVVLGGLIETKTTRMKVKAEETGALLPAEFKAKIVEGRRPHSGQRLLRGKFHCASAVGRWRKQYSSLPHRYGTQTFPGHVRRYLPESRQS